jgi:16S rRNA (guanine966-N2)-methyltransferase
MTTRPIPDRVKEALFSMLGQRTRGANIIDAFAGSGSIGLEALSRGGATCMFIEQDTGALGALEKNIELLHCKDRATVVKSDALGPSLLSRVPTPVDLVFFDPPYPLIQNPLGYKRIITQLSALAGLMASDGFIILRTPWPFFLDSGELAEEAKIDARTKKPVRKGSPRTKNWAETESTSIAGQGVKGVDFKGKGARGKGGPKQAGKMFELDGEMMEQLSDEEIEALMNGEELDLVEDVFEPQPRKSTGKHHKHDASMAAILGEHGETLVNHEAQEAMDQRQQAGSDRVMPDLVIPGTRGPESHRYGTTAVHFYMRAK